MADDKVTNARYPKNDRDRNDRDALANPDIRGSRAGRRSINEDGRAKPHDDPERVKRAWKDGGRK